MFEPRAGWRTIFSRTQSLLRDQSQHKASARRVCSPGVSSLGQGAVFGCSLYSCGVATSRLATSKPGMDDDLFLAATGSGTIAVVSSSGASVDLNNPAHHGQGDGILGFDVDPCTGVIVTGSFNGAVNVMSVNFREHHSLSDTPVRTLRKMLARRGASAAGCIEKSDIVKRVRATGACPLIRLEATLPRHGATVVSTSICGRMFATGSNDGTAKIGRMDPSVLYRFQDPPEDEGEEEGGKKGKSGGKAAGAGSGVSAASGKHDSAGASGKRAEIVRTIDPQVSASSTEAGAAADGESPAIDVVFLQKTVMHTGDKASFLKRYDVETGALLQSWDTAHGWVWSVCPTETTYREFEDTPEDCRVVLTGGTDAVVRVWDSRVSVRHSPEAARSAGLDRVASQPVTQLRLSSGSQAPVAGMQVCWSKNTVYAASFDGNLHVLDVRAPGSCVPSVAEEWWGYEPNVAGKSPAGSAGAGSAPATG